MNLPFFNKKYQLNKSNAWSVDFLHTTTNEPQQGPLKKHLAEIITIITILGFIGTTLPSFASTHGAPSINYQGRLTTSTGTSVTDTSRNMKFAIYDASSHGTCLWATGPGSGTDNCSSMGAVIVNVSAGLFNVPLGNGDTNNPAISANFNNGIFFLEVQIDNEKPIGTFETFATRKQISPTPHTYNGDMISGLTASGFTILVGESRGLTPLSGIETSNSYTLQSISLNEKDVPGATPQINNEEAATVAMIIKNEATALHNKESVVAASEAILPISDQFQESKMPTEYASRSSIGI